MTAPTLPLAEPTGRDRRGAGHGTALLVTSVILLVVGLGAAAAALVVRHDTGAIHGSTAPVRDQVRELAATEEHAVEGLRQLRTRARATNETLAALFAAEAAQVEASNHAVDVANQAVDQYNTAKTPGVAAAFAGAGDAALTDLEEKTAAVRGAGEAVQRAIASLQGTAGG